MGQYMRESMLLALAKAAGDLNAAEEARLLGGEGETFTEEQKLSELEEGEVARRALKAHEVADEGDEDLCDKGRPATPTLTPAGLDDVESSS